MPLAVRRWLTTSACILISLFSSFFLAAQEANKLIIQGPALENCEVTFRYFKARQIAKAVAIKVTILDGQIEEPIETGFDGVEVFVQSRATPIKATLRADNQELASEQLDKPGSLKVTSGKIGRVDYKPTEIDPSNTEFGIFETWVKAVNEQTTSQALVSDAPEAKIDFQCLDVFGRELLQRIGQIDLDKSLAGLIAWNETGGTRMLSGVLYGQSGLCGVRLITVKGRLWDVQPNCAELPDSYFVEPLMTEPYVKKAAFLTQLLFSGDAKRAHQLYAAQFQEQVKVEQLAKLSETLKQRFGNEIRTMELKKTQLSEYDFAKKSRLLNVDLVVETKTGNRCISRVVYNIATDRTRVGKANLGAINVTQVFNSSHPQAAKVVQDLLEGIGASNKADQVVASLPAELAPKCDKGQLQAMFNRLTAQFKDQKPDIDFDLWTVTQHEKNVSASGPFKFGDKDCYAEFQFVGDAKLIGFSFYGPSLAESTMTMFQFPGSIAETGKRFWTALLSEQAEAAHAMLDKDFQSQFSLEDLKKQLAEPEAKPSKFKSVSVDWVRMSNQIARPAELMATVFLTAEFEDGQITQVACDIALPEKEGEAIVYDFTNEFEIDFSVASIPTVGSDRDAAALVIEAFQSDSSEKLLSMINPGRREAIDQASLTAYLKNLREIMGKITGPTSIARIVDYQTGGKRYRCNFNLQCESGESLPVEVWIYQGYLERFVVSHSRINDFVNLLTDKKGIHARVDSFVQAWCRDVSETRLFMVSSLNTERTMTTLNSMKEQLETAIGKLEKLEIVDEKAGEQPGELEFLVTLKGDRGEKKAKVLVDVGAFGGLVSAVSIQ